MTVGDLDTPSAPSEPTAEAAEAADAAAPSAPAGDEEPARDEARSADPPSAEGPSTAVLDALAALGERVDALAAEARSATARAEARERVIVHQHDELDALRAERRGGQLRPLVVGLQKLRAELLAETDPSRAVLDYYADGVLAVLESCGVERVAVEPGDPFDPAAHTAARTVDGAPEDHRRVVELLTEGWAERDTGRVLAPAKVAVGRHRPTETQHEEPTDV